MLLGKNGLKYFQVSKNYNIFGKIKNFDISRRIKIIFSDNKKIILLKNKKSFSEK